MKRFITLIIPAALLAGIAITLSLTPNANAADFGTVAHTESRFCGHHCHHHGHYWSCGECTFYCCGHD